MGITANIFWINFAGGKMDLNVGESPYKKIYEGDMVSPTSLKIYVSLLVLEFAVGGSAINKAKEGDM